MTTAYLVAACACWCGAGAAVAWRLTSDHYRFRLSEATASAARYKAWWERDSGKMLIAQAELDVIAEQRRMAGRQSHKAGRALFADRTEKLKQCVASRDANDVLPAVHSSASGISAAPQRRLTKGGSGQQCTPNEPTGRGRGTPPTQAVAPQRQFGRRSCPTNRAVESAPAEFSPMKKGAI